MWTVYSKSPRRFKIAITLPDFSEQIYWCDGLDEFNEVMNKLSNDRVVHIAMSVSEMLEVDYGA